MTDERRRVIGGVDAHADADQAAVLDERGALLATRSCVTTAAGCRVLLSWLGGFGVVDRVGVESTGSYAAALTRALVGEGVRVLDVNQPYRDTRRRCGKTDVIEVELAARHALSLQASVTPKSTSGSWSRFGSCVSRVRAR